MGGGLDNGLPHGFHARVRELLDLLSSAVFERKEAIANAFCDLPPLRQIGDNERLGAEFPPPTQAAWNDYLNVGALEPVGALLRLKHATLIKFQERTNRVRLLRHQMEERIEILCHLLVN